MDYVLHILILIGIYITLSVSLNLLVGYTGLLSIAHAAFFGIGAYVAALMAIKLGSPFIINIFCALIFSGLLGAIVGAPSLRIRDDYFVISSFAFQIIIFSIMNNWVSVTGGPMGLPGIPPISLFGYQIINNIYYLFLVYFFCGATITIVKRLVKSPFGRVLNAIREDEVFAEALGKNIAKAKLSVFIISAGMASISGVLYAYYISYIDPTSFTVMESIFIVSIVIIGGAGSLWGPVLGSLTLVLLPELFRFMGLPSSTAANIRQILYGVLLIAFVMWKPSGLLGNYSFQREISHK
jgi:branched-chain amino acid transport system permease protein